MSENKKSNTCVTILGTILECTWQKNGRRENVSMGKYTLRPLLSFVAL